MWGGCHLPVAIIATLLGLTSERNLKPLNVTRPGFLIVTLRARDLLSCVDRAIVLSNGKIIASGSPQEIINDTEARSVYFGDEFRIN